MDKANLTSNRVHSFDVMRIVAICAVILGHTASDYVNGWPSDSIEFISNNLIGSFCRCAVIIFIMISGALMLNEDKKISNKKIVHSALNIFILLMVWNIFYAAAYDIVKPLVFNEKISVTAIISTFFTGHYHMWYLTVLIGLYLITPILRFFIKRENLPLITVYLNFSIVLCFVLPFADYFVNHFTGHENLLTNYISRYRMYYFYEDIVFYILGWYILNTEIKKSRRIKIYICGLLSVLATAFCTQMFFDNTQSQNNFFYADRSLTVFLYSVALFIFLHYLLTGKNYTASPLVQKLSGLTFGVYLIHPVFLFALKLVFRDIGPAPVSTIVIFLGAAILSFFTVFVISKIPVIKMLVRG